ncbi:DUF2268 domain-containing protein [Peribacillus sp. SCS-155]|uniref:DUF2268 domain-containing protein n=1 Tax=Peribacillus sedimenti TaxID=3115297 RepID=UPI003905E0A4
MAVIQTKEWLNDNFSNPVKICGSIMDTFSEDRPDRVYEYLQQHGMYKPDAWAKKSFEFLVKNDAWSKAEQLFEKYKKLWGGPDIPVYLFPMKAVNGFLRRRENKAGLAFRDKLFLFLHQGYDDKEMEAVMVHEYHHVCRLQKKEAKEETAGLLDSMIMEGLAEHAVEKHVGKEYLANWTKLYSDKEMEQYWKKYLKGAAEIPRQHPLHDKLLFGKRPYPSMMGYSTGFYLVKKKGFIPISKTFTIESTEFLPE